MSNNKLGIHAMLLFESSVSENLIFLKQFLKAALYSRRITGLKDFILRTQLFSSQRFGNNKTSQFFD